MQNSLIIAERFQLVVNNFQITEQTWQIGTLITFTVTSNKQTNAYINK